MEFFLMKQVFLRADGDVGQEKGEEVVFDTAEIEDSTRTARADII